VSPRPTIFISAVSKELSSARQLVANTLSFLGYDPVWQEIFGTEEGDLREVLRRRIDASKGVVQLVGKCYGAEPPTADEQFGRVSYTQYEALYAKERGKKVWYLLLDESFPADRCEEESEEKQKLQQAYCERVQADVHLYHALNSREALETSVLKLRDDLTSLRRGVRRWAVAVLALLVVLAAGIAWLLHSQHRQTIAIQGQGQQVSAILERNQKMEQALVRLAQVEAQSKQPGEKLTPEEQRARAYAVLEKELGLSAGTLAKELPGFALELYSRSDTTPLMRARAAYALNRFDEAEKLSLEAGEQDQKAYETANRVADERRKAALEAYELAGWSAEKRIQYGDALEHLRKAERLTDRARDPLEWARLQFAVAWVLYDQGQYQQVESVLREVLKERERLLGSEHPDAIAARHYIARAVYSQGRYAEAEAEFRAMLKIRGKVLGPEHPDTLLTRSSLANAVVAQGRYAEGETEYRTVLKSREKVLGPEHPQTLTTRNNLAVTLDQEGRYAEAEAEYRAVLKVRERVLGPEHPETLSARNNLGVILDEEGKYAEAEAEWRATLKVREKVLGPEHPVTLQTRGNLAIGLDHKGKYAEAETEDRTLLNLQEKVLGPEHPNTLESGNNLADALVHEGKYVEGEAEYRAVITLKEKALGRDHPSTLKARNGLADALVQEGKYAEAEAEYRVVLKFREKLLGPERPDTLATRGGLAMAIAKQQRHTEAEMMFSEVLPKFEKTWGMGHPVTLELCEDYAECLKSQGKLAQAKELAQRAAEGARKALGPDHPNTTKYEELWHDLETALTKK
jgi:tetratricopeptide (TPR) repeat protein